MGSAIASALARAGFEVRGYDRSEEARRSHVARGGASFDSARAAIVGTATTVFSLPTDRDVADVCFGPEGIAPTLREGGLIVDTTTARPEESIETADRLRAIGVSFVDASISGSSHMVADGDVVIMVGGRPEDVGRAEPILRAVARSVHHMGPVGTGVRTKLAVNLVLGIHRLALAEGLLLGTRGGLDPVRLLDVLRDGAAYSKAMDIWGPRMVGTDRRPPTSRIQQHHKDVRLMLDEGRRSATSLRLASVLDAVLEAAEAQGRAEEDLSILYEVLVSLASDPDPGSEADGEAPVR
jgi:3-hydroxyisobutyrate dehydrogenase-like beta-hydroxyacid dehydrogenase